MGLEQYSGMDMETKVTTLLVKMDNIEKFVLTKPCPGPMCNQHDNELDRIKNRVSIIEQYKAKREAEITMETACRDDVLERLDALEEWKTTRVAEIADQARQEDVEASREAWVIPMWVAVLSSVGALAATVLLEVF